ncbi:MAG: hypothetical protein ACLGG0_08155 [Bacteriovoracia bacterium]
MFKYRWDVDDHTVVNLECSMLGKYTVWVNNREVLSKRNLFKISTNLNFQLTDGRSATIRVSNYSGRPEAELKVLDQEVVPQDDKLKNLCPSCQTENKTHDKFCFKCGSQLTSPQVQIRQKKVKEASKTIRVLSVIFFISGIILYFVGAATFDNSLKQLEQYQANDVFPQEINGQKYTVEELRNRIKIEKWSLLILNVFLGVIMFGLSFWAKKSPLGALLVAAAIYAAVMVLNTIVDPRTIGQGIFIKIIVITALYKGIKSALELRTINGG